MSEAENAQAVVQAATAKDAIQAMVAQLQPGQPVPMHLWGKDHWSTFGYACSGAVDYHTHNQGKRKTK